MLRAGALADREPETLGEAIRSARIERGWSQRRLAVEIDVSERLVSRWESGAGYPSVPMLVRLSLVFGWELPWPVEEPDQEGGDDSRDRPTGRLVSPSLSGDLLLV